MQMGKGEMKINSGQIPFLGIRLYTSTIKDNILRLESYSRKHKAIMVHTTYDQWHLEQSDQYLVGTACKQGSPGNPR
jgi:hypothetical protein